MSALLSIAIKLRLIDEQLRDASKNVRESFEFECGDLWGTDTETSSAPLTMREACNKIVHAGEISYFVDDSKYNPHHFIVPRFLTPQISTYGEFRGASWKAVIDIDKFVEAGYWLSTTT